MAPFTLTPKLLKLMMHIWPPFWFTGVSFVYISDDFRHIRTKMSLRFYNKNIYGIQYGGNLYSMTDPCHAIMVMHNLGSAYRVIDSGAKIDFIKPGTTTVTADCIVTDEDLSDIKNKTASGEKYFKDFHIDVKDRNGDVVAAIVKTVYIRKKRPSKST